jgi:2-amino-4-hydroxy-6-hydroxymethyldihydropteridine diphosphokinase
MSKAFVAIGSNYNAQCNIQQAIKLLELSFSVLNISNVYRNSAITENESKYLNLVVSFDYPTSSFESLVESATELISELKGIEKTLGRLPKAQAKGKVSIDLDLVLFQGLDALVEGRRIPCPDILKHSFILAPLSEIADGELEQNSGKSYALFWSEFNQKKHPLERAKLNF